MIDRDHQMFGMSTDRIRTEYMDSITGRLIGQEMVVMSILSDVQEMLHAASTLPSESEPIRKQLNVAKFILGELMDQRRVAYK